MMSRLKDSYLRLRAVRSNVLVGEDFHVGPNSVLWAPSRLRIGDDVYVGKNVTIEVDGVIGDGVLIANNVGIIGRDDHDKCEIGVAIRKATWVGDSPEQLSDSVIIGSDVWLGFGAIVLSGVRIGDSAIVAAGAVVTRDVEPNAIVAGNPAKALRNRFSDSDLADHWRRLEENHVRLGLARVNGEV